LRKYLHCLFTDILVYEAIVIVCSCIQSETNEIIEGNLKLVSRYRLLTAAEADSFGPIPNSASSSDHYPLLATFFHTF
jgi:hypothetical protein